MKKLKKIVFIIVTFCILSCSSSYLKNYKPIITFLELEKTTNKKQYILRIKESNSQTFRIFNRGEGAEHIVYPNEIDYTSKLFNGKYWKKLYTEYSQDTIKKLWKDEDFIGYKFIEGNRKQLFGRDFLKKYPDVEDVIILSEPIYYHNKKYIMFFYNIDNYLYSSSPQIVVVMKKEKNKWVLVEKIGDYSCSGCL